MTSELKGRKQCLEGSLPVHDLLLADSAQPREAAVGMRCLKTEVLEDYSNKCLWFSREQIPLQVCFQKPLQFVPTWVNALTC